MLESRIGQGALVLSSLSYFVSNEAMRRERHPALLTWLIGSNKKVVFDEYHHGLATRTNTAMLIRRYGLQSVLVGLFILALLYIWRHSTSLVPPTTDPTSKLGIAKGKDTASGLTNILRRHIPLNTLLQHSFEAWNQTTLKHDQKTEQKRTQIVTLLKQSPQKDKNPVTTYKEICAIIKTSTSQPPLQTSKTTPRSQPKQKETP